MFVAWNDNDDDNGGVYFAKSGDNGKSFTKEARLNHDVEAGEPQVFTSGENVYVVWTTTGEYSDYNPYSNTYGHKSESESNSTTTYNDTGNIYFAKSDNNGEMFSSPESLVRGFTNPLNAEIIGHGEKVYVVTQASVDNTAANQDIFLIESPDNGGTFGDAINLSNNSGISECPSITISGNNVYLTWQDKGTGNNEAYYKQITM